MKMKVKVKTPKPIRRRKPFRRFTYFVIFLVIFAGSLYATYNYLLGRGLINRRFDQFRQTNRSCQYGHKSSPVADYRQMIRLEW